MRLGKRRYLEREEGRKKKKKKKKEWRKGAGIRERRKVKSRKGSRADR